MLHDLDDRVVVISASGMHRHPRRLINNDEGFVFENNLNGFVSDRGFVAVQCVRNHISIIYDRISTTVYKLLLRRMAAILLSKYRDRPRFNSFFLAIVQLLFS